MVSADFEGSGWCRLRIILFCFYWTWSYYVMGLSLWSVYRHNVFCVMHCNLCPSCLILLNSYHINPWHMIKVQKDLGGCILTHFQARGSKLFYLSCVFSIIPLRVNKKNIPIMFWKRGQYFTYKMYFEGVQKFLFCIQFWWSFFLWIDCVETLQYYVDVFPCWDLALFCWCISTTVSVLISKKNSAESGQKVPNSIIFHPFSMHFFKYNAHIYELMSKN